MPDRPIPFRRILAATDLEPWSDAPVRQADSLARAAHAALGVVLAGPFANEDAARARVAERVRALTGREEHALSIFIEDGPVPEAILRRARAYQADLIAVGSHGQGATLRRVLLGSTAEAVVHRAEASVLVARDPLGDGPVIAACELRREPPAIVEAAAAIAGCYGAELEAVHAVEISLGDLALALSAFFGGQFPPGLDPEGREDLDELIRAALGTQLDLAGASGRAVVLHGSPRSELVHYAQRTNARLVVVGRGSHPRLVKLAIGSVADAVVRSSGRSVLVVKG